MVSSIMNKKPVNEKISDALDLKQDEDRIARSDGKTDARKD